MITAACPTCATEAERLVIDPAYLNDLLDKLAKTRRENEWLRQQNARLTVDLSDAYLKLDERGVA